MEMNRQSPDHVDQQLRRRAHAAEDQLRLFFALRVLSEALPTRRRLARRHAAALLAVSLAAAVALVGIAFGSHLVPSTTQEPGRPRPAPSTVTAPTPAVTSSAVTSITGLPISTAGTPPPIQAGVKYQASLLRPFFTVSVPGDGWGAKQYANKPVVNADLVLHPELGDNPDGVLSFVGGLSEYQPITPNEFIDQERSLDHQSAYPVTSGTIAGGLPTLEYEADVVGGDFISYPELRFPTGWRIHLIALAVGGKTMGIAYGAPAAKWDAFARIARQVLDAVRFAPS